MQRKKYFRFFFKKVNNLQRDFILDSVEAVQIEECNSFLCLSNPCKNSGACEETDGKITCKCAAGYEQDKFILKKEKNKKQ